jgi:hypothetical protein
MQGNLRQQIAEFVAPYQRAKPDLNLQFIDPTSNPNETKAANVRVNGELIVAYGARSEHLTNLSEQKHGEHACNACCAGRNSRSHT